MQGTFPQFAARRGCEGPDLTEQGHSQGMPRAPSEGWPPMPQREGEPSHEPQEERGWHLSSLVTLVDLSAFISLAI